MHRPPRFQFFTKFVKPEGAHDTTFLELLKEYYCARGKLRVEIKKGHGKDQSSIVNEAINRIGAYDKKIVVMDDDKSMIEMEKADKLAVAHEIIVLRNTPCIEGILIKILEPNKNINNMSSHELKIYFEKNYISKNNRTDKNAYRNKFPKAVLDEARERLPELNKMIKIFEEQ